VQFTWLRQLLLVGAHYAGASRSQPSAHSRWPKGPARSPCLPPTVAVGPPLCIIIAGRSADVQQRHLASSAAPASVGETTAFARAPGPTAAYVGQQFLNAGMRKTLTKDNRAPSWPNWCFWWSQVNSAMYSALAKFSSQLHTTVKRHLHGRLQPNFLFHLSAFVNLSLSPSTLSPCYFPLFHSRLKHFYSHNSNNRLHLHLVTISNVSSKLQTITQ